jgi:hypothetical protein
VGVKPHLVFRGYERPAAHALATGQREAGRLVGALPLEARATPLGEPPAMRLVSVPFAFAGPRDVAALRPGTVALVSPAPGALDAEADYCPFAVLADPGLPWRYTLGQPQGGGLRPWLVLVVGLADGEVTVRGDGRVELAGSVTDDYDLAESSRWAHVQSATDDDPATPGIDERWPVSRLVSLRPLEGGKDYVAALVPAFVGEGDAWSGASGATVPAYHVWRFRTSESPHTFRELAFALEPPAEPPPLGVNPLAYPLPGARPLPELRARGALTRGAEAPGNTRVRDHLRTLARPPSDPAGRRIVGLPRYGDAWAVPESARWRRELAEDARHRVAAGLGGLAGVVLQEEIADAARERFGAAAVAAQRIASLAAGLAASGALWRRLPSDPAHRLLVFGPALGRIATDDGAAVASALDRVTGGASPLPAALLSSAARRALRPGTSPGRVAAPGALSPGAVLAVVNRCPEPERPSSGLPDDDKLVGGELRGALERAAEGQFQPDDSVAEELDRDPEAIVGFARELVSETERAVECDPVPLEDVAGRLTAAIDPTRPDAAVATRVLGTIDGLDAAQPLAPVELCPDLDLPGWRFLRDHARDWLLPGVDTMPPDSAAAVVTNPTFVDAFLVGLNTQALAELRWRGLPVAVGCTPLRRFWDYIADGADEDEELGPDDIRGVAHWTAASRLGQRAESTDAPDTDAWRDSHSDVPGENVVVVFRTELFRRYPKTLVYLWEHGADLKPTPERVWPTFRGAIGPEHAFFGFPKPLSALASHYVVLEEVPEGYRFDRERAVQAGSGDGGVVAEAAFVDPVRVLIRGSVLVPESDGG